MYERCFSNIAFLDLLHFEVNVNFRKSIVHSFAQSYQFLCYVSQRLHHPVPFDRRKIFHVAFREKVDFFFFSFPSCYTSMCNPLGYDRLARKLLMGYGNLSMVVTDCGKIWEVRIICHWMMRRLGGWRLVVGRDKPTIYTY